MQTNQRTTSILHLRAMAAAGLLALFLTGCATPETTPVPAIPHSPVRVYISENTLTNVQQTLLLPPMGIDDPLTRDRLQQQLFSSARRHFAKPLRVVSPGSAYSNYITERNLMNSDGTLNAPEVVMIGTLMNATHVICPIFEEIRPYSPQKITLNITIVDTETGQTPGELSAVFDARESDIREWFMDYSFRHKADGETEDDLNMKLRSPAEFQAFISDICFSMLAERLPF